MPFENHFLQEKGIGYYKFKVKVLSSDIETIGNSEWSAFSPALEVKDISVKVSSDLNQLVNDVNNNNLQPDDIRTAVQNMDTQDLQTALLADKDNVFATQHMAQLERMAGGPAQVQVTQDASAFNVQDVSIVGANLNNKAEEDESITLVVDKPEKQHVIPERYNSAVAVRFSMTLENVEDPKHLEVPVKITLPVPSTINPDFLVIMHYDVYGGHELILPHVYEMNGKYYAEIRGVKFELSDFQQKALKSKDQKPASIVAGVRPQHITVGSGKLSAKIEVSEMMGTEYNIHAASGDDSIVMVIPTIGLGADVSMGKTVNFDVSPDLIQLFDEQTGNNLIWYDEESAKANAPVCAEY